MSDMIERLSALSREAGTNASASLNARGTLDSMEERIERGVRRRRRSIAGVTAVTVLVAGAGAAIAPRLLDGMEAPALPGTEVEIVGTNGAITVLSDGSISLVTSRGEIVDIPPVEPEEFQPYATVSSKQMCEGPDLSHFPLGWEYHQDSAKQLLTFGRPQFLLYTGPQLLAQGSTHVASSRSDRPALGFQLEADTAIAPHLMLRSASWSVGEFDTVWFASKLDANPTVTVEGGDGGARPAALIQSGPIHETDYCYYSEGKDFNEPHYLRYLQVDVFLSDHRGNTVLLATHRSWSALDFSQIPEASP
ncbi:MAG: hypothetical protein CVT64_00485 [Actinobacteria bacterium HGW-Actinobacteria-4]|nr:MAG: hypothetical protein CVT64_00485 [Actinobacteria bacterium HGW-Actinobacteria-4]